MASVLCGDIALYSSQFPSFLYPHGTVFNEEDAASGLFRGEYFLKVSTSIKLLSTFYHDSPQVFRTIYTGSSSAIDRFRRASKPSKAELHGMTRVTGRAVAYTAVQVCIRFARLSVG
jgi:hypothetical protein